MNMPYYTHLPLPILPVKKCRRIEQLELYAHDPIPLLSYISQQIGPVWAGLSTYMYFGSLCIISCHEGHWTVVSSCRHCLEGGRKRLVSRWLPGRLLCAEA